MTTQIWQFIKALFPNEVIAEGVEITNAVLELTERLQEEGPKIAQIAPLVIRIDSLLDVLNSPLTQIVGSSLPFVPIALGLLQFYRKLTKTEPNLAQCVSLVSQVAYLESFRMEMIKLNASLQPQARLEKLSNQPASEAVKQQIKQLEDLEIDDEEARRTLVHFHESKLAQAFNQSVIARLRELDFSAEEARTLVERVALNTNCYLLPTLLKVRENVQPLVDWYCIGGREVFEKYFSINTYLEEQIEPLPLELVFNELFSFRDVYVPLKAQLLKYSGEPDEVKPLVELEQWAKDCLNDEHRKDRVIFIQGGAGRGKSVFCRLFADWVRRHEHPRWTPILIRLRDARTLQRNFEETLQQAVGRDFAVNDPGWLTDRNIRFLFLLDGFDELLMEGRTSGGLQEFLLQVGKFQENCANNSEKGHRVLITGRTLALQSIERTMPPNLERVEITQMNAELQDHWFAKWEKLVGEEKTCAFKQFLKDNRCPESIRGTDRKPGLAQEPLLLYLLAAMHRDGELTIDLFEKAQGTKAKLLIYERTLDWVLTKQRQEFLLKQTTGFENKDLQRIFTEAGLCVMQAGGEFAPITMIEQRLTSDKAGDLIEQARQRLGDNPLRNALAAFYLQPGNQDGSVEFAHKSFSEFLCAKRIIESLEDWTYLGHRNKFEVSLEQMNWEIYDLLGAPVLVPGIVEYLSTFLLKEIQDLQVEVLFKRLHEFYMSWCKGEFMDGDLESLPQKKMRSLRKQLGDRGIQLGQRQIDVYAGLNVMVLLLELHRSAQTRNGLRDRIVFHPCAQRHTKVFDEFQLRHVISYSDCVQIGAFSGVCGLHLRSTDLSKAYLLSVFLRAADLKSANLSQANLISAFLMSADLSNADLSNAFLMSADLTNANLTKANLTDADLTNANLTKANLTDANLTNANLINANVSHADLRSVNFTDAELVAANLKDADLQSANLTNAKLINANLRSANLTNANLRSANLTNANLRSANLTNANLRSADLTNANLEFSNLEGIRWDESTQWRGMRGLGSARNVPEALKQPFGLGIDKAINQGKPN